MPPQFVVDRMREGIVIPAHPLALTDERQFDERRQRALTRYYHAAEAGGVAVGVHTTQFEIRDPEHRLYEPVLRCSAEVLSEQDAATGRQSVRIAGLCGPTEQALQEAKVARVHGYHLGLLSLTSFEGANDDALIRHCTGIAQEIPLMGFYLQPAAGGRILSEAFWRRFLEIPNVIAIKIAPFNRYQTLDVIRAVADVGRAQDVALYTGNDDNIVIDLLTRFRVQVGGHAVELQFAGGLLGHWAYWTRRAVELLAECKRVRANGCVPSEQLVLAAQVTDSNSAVFDAAHQYQGANPGIHEVLRRQGLLATSLCLAPTARLSPGQAEEIDRVCRVYPHLTDDDFVREHLSEWLD
ncbi:dihydrodipicolinate synthase family protein [Aggregatilinea lenta]|uniref:dihydrodipicolinate synthase family protein n=1 Tax=Aggregatilinea lenta TaxID=913108 RepID=UPI000E5A3216